MYFDPRINYSLLSHQQYMEIKAQSKLTLAEIASLAWNADISLNLDRIDIAFITTLKQYMEINTISQVTEQELREIYSVISELAGESIDSEVLRATNSLKRLELQRILIRADLGGITQEIREFTLSDFAVALAATIYEENRLDSEGLKVLMGTLRADFTQILKQVENGGDEEHWRKTVIIPLQHKTRALIERVDQRQRAMDKEQAELRKQVQTMLDEDWFDAIKACNDLLTETSNTLGELNRILGEEVDQAMVLLEELTEVAQIDDAEDALNEILRVRQQMERLALWGEQRFSEWTTYNLSVHNFIRDVVRMDPDRAVRNRLTQAIRDYSGIPWKLVITDTINFLHLREPKSGDDDANVVWQGELEPTYLSEHVPQTAIIEMFINEIDTLLMEQGEIDLVHFLKTKLEDHTEELVFTLTGGIARHIMQKCTTDYIVIPKWTMLADRMQIQGLKLAEVEILES